MQLFYSFSLQEIPREKQGARNSFELFGFFGSLAFCVVESRGGMVVVYCGVWCLVQFGVMLSYFYYTMRTAYCI